MQSMGHSLSMLIEAYIEALLVDEELADLVGEALDAGLIPDEMACIAWLMIASTLDVHIS